MDYEFDVTLALPIKFEESTLIELEFGVDVPVLKSRELVRLVRQIVDVRGKLLQAVYALQAEIEGLDAEVLTLEGSLATTQEQLFGHTWTAYNPASPPSGLHYFALGTPIYVEEIIDEVPTQVFDHNEYRTVVGTHAGPNQVTVIESSAQTPEEFIAAHMPFVTPIYVEPSTP